MHKNLWWLCTGFSLSYTDNNRKEQNSRRRLFFFVFFLVEFLKDLFPCFYVQRGDDLLSRFAAQHCFQGIQASGIFAKRLALSGTHPGRDSWRWGRPTVTAHEDQREVRMEGQSPSVNLSSHILDSGSWPEPSAAAWHVTNKCFHAYY